uniref:Phosphorylase b kinase gamma catalytic liver testis isoform isoform x1 n=1 Tax=Tetraselmis sp. GSL018 TaxID=582737 RepID=A0A061QT28_9CHLO|mmetsp:Transcript_23719/g.56576  ORF Transcript_23719/g.56576 Transcript_23719/m.56576 type:complete len:321 (+) Transcript_23719:185-1147(+)
MDPASIRVDSLEFREEIGSGACGTVRRALHRKTGQEFAVKVIPNSCACADTESAVLEKLWSTRSTRKKFGRRRSLDFIVKYLGAAKASAPEPQVASQFLVFDYLKGGDLATLLERNGGCLDERTAKTVLLQVVKGLQSLHSRNIAHCDLKLSNIAFENLDNLSSVRLIDLGSACDLSVSPAGVKSPVGTPVYWGPEVVRCFLTAQFCSEVVPYSKEADLWALGVIMYKLLSGQLPFPAADMECLFGRIQSSAVLFPENIWHEVSFHARDLIRKLLEKDPKQRISCREALKHPWFSSAKYDRALAFGVWRKMSHALAAGTQ